MRQRTDEERRAVVEAWRTSGETVEAFCTRQGISRESLKRWRRRTGVGTGESFLPVTVVQGSDTAATTPCVVLVGEFVRIEYDERTSEATLARAIRAAVAACGPTCGR